jgi:hypothetical protein
MLNNKPIFLAVLICFLACNSSDETSSVQVNSSTVSSVEPTTPVVAVSACSKLTLDDLKSVYPDKTFGIEVNRNDEPNIYEALSACRYQEEGKEAFDKYYVDLEIRAQQTPAEALRKLSDKKEMDYDNKGKVVNGVGDGAYYYNYSMVAGGPKLEFVKDNVYFKLNIQTIKSGSFASLEGDIMNLARKVLE